MLFGHHLKWNNRAWRKDQSMDKCPGIAAFNTQLLQYLAKGLADHVSEVQLQAGVGGHYVFIVSTQLIIGPTPPSDMNMNSQIFISDSYHIPIYDQQISQCTRGFIDLYFFSFPPSPAPPAQPVKSYTSGTWGRSWSASRSTSKGMFSNLVHSENASDISSLFYIQGGRESY